MRNVAADDDDLPCILACTDRASQLNGALLEYVWKTLFVRWESSCKRENDSFPVAFAASLLGGIYSAALACVGVGPACQMLLNIHTLAHCSYKHTLTVTAAPHQSDLTKCGT